MAADESLPDQLVALIDRLRRLDLAHNPPEAAGVSPAQMQILLSVGRSPGLSLRDLAGGLGVAAPTASVAVRRLERARLLRRTPDPNDGRAIHLYLAPRGEKLHRDLQDYRRCKMQQVLAGLSPEEQLALVDLLERALASAETNENRANEKNTV